LDGAVWWFKPAPSQLGCQIIHHSFICAIFVSKPAPNSNDPVFVHLGNIKLGEAPAKDAAREREVGRSQERSVQ